ncbi:hypothetical protein [Kocuria sp.]|uniref:hypothetical protein n=1 Tax=Kocuria sp. TaxID=1871328 RepID=UPI0026DD9A88|nr:hypothetical protein [Kocuria sp.]MDO4920056.1 hypothetical protein [Kocuria sp.]
MSAPQPMPASQMDDFRAALAGVLEVTDDDGMVELCRTRYGATHQETAETLTAIKENR